MPKFGRSYAWHCVCALSLALCALLISLTAVAQPGIGASLEDALVDDADADSQVDRGDTVGYTAIIESNGTVGAQNVQISIPLDPNMTLVPGSILVGPIALDDFAPAVNLGQQVVMDVLANDRDIDGALDPATVTVVTPPASGTASVNTTTGEITYTSTGGAGSDVFTYMVSDDDGLVSREALVSIDVNTCPSAADDAVSLSESATQAGSVFADNGNGADSDPDAGDTISVTAVDGSAGNVGVSLTLASGLMVQIDDDGTLNVDTDGAFESLADGEDDSENLSYTLSDGDCEDSATLTVTVNGENDCPTAQNDALSTTEDAAFGGTVFADNGNGVDADPDASDTRTVTELDGNAASVGAQVALASGALLTVNADGSFAYDVNGAWNALAQGETASDTFTYTLSDGVCADSATATITVTGENDCPSASPDTFSTDQDTATNGDVLADNGSGADSDVDTLDTLTVTELDGSSAAIGVATAIASGALVTLNSDGTFAYDPNGAFDQVPQGDSAVDTFDYTISDGACTDTATASVTVSGLNDCPIAQTDSADIAESAVVNGNVFDDNGNGPDTDPDTGDTFTVIEVNGVAGNVGNTFALFNGALVLLNADGTFTYDTNGAFEDLDTGSQAPAGFTYTISDGDCTTGGAVSIAIIGENDCPDAADDTVTTDEDTVLNGSLFVDNGNGADADPDTGDTFFVTEVNGSPANIGQILVVGTGNLRVFPDGSFTFDPNGTYEALDDANTLNQTFTYTISDGDCADSATVSLDVTGVNDCPIAQADSFTTDEDTSTNGDVLADNGNGVDSDADNTDSITVTELNGSSAVIGVATAIASGALVTLNADGTFTYDPNGAFEDLATAATDSDTFAYTISDGDCTGNGTVTIDITGVNDCPTVNDDADSTDEDTPLAGDVFADNGSGADTDPEGGALVLLTVNGSGPGTIALASGATVNFAAGGAFTYDPNDQFEALANGDSDSDSFTYTVDDGSGTCTETGTFTLTINGANDCPTAQDDAGSTNEDTPMVGNVFIDNGNGADSDPDTGDSFAVSALNGSAVAVGVPTALVSGAQVTLNANGSFTYDPLAAFQSLSTGQNGNDSFIYAISDGDCGGTATVSLTIAGISDPPVAAAQAGTTVGHVEFIANEGGLSASAQGTPAITNATLSLLDGANDPDTASGSLSAIAAAGLSTNGGSYEVFADGSFAYRPPLNFTGSDTFPFQITDGLANSAAVNVTMTVGTRVWFINNGVGGSGGAGTSTDPFRSVAEFNAANGNVNGPAAGHRAYLFNTGVDYTTGFSLLNNQTVEGGGVALVVDTISLLAAGTRPNVTSTTNNGVTLAQNNTLRGFNITNCPGFFKISGTAAGNVAINNMTLSGTGGIINITTSAAFGSNVSFDSVGSSSSPGSAINLVGCTGTLGLGVSGTGIGGSAVSSDAIRVSGGSVSFTYLGSLTKINAGRLISISDTTGGAINFDRSTTNGLGGNSACTGILIDGCAGSVTIGGTTAGTPPYVSLIGPNGIEILGDASNNQTGAVTINNAAITTTSGHGFTINGDVSGAAGDDVAATISLNNLDITNPTGRVASISGLGGGSVTFDANSDIVRDNGGSGIICDSNAGGTITFASTTKTLTTNLNPGVSLTSNPGTTIDFTGGNLDIDTSSGIAFNATGGGTVTVQGSNNTLNSGTGTALNVASTTIGASDLTFQSIAANGGTNGILLNSTGSSGGLSVTGDGGGSNNGSGGIIQNTSGPGVLLSSSRDVSLSHMNVQSATDDGIRGTSVTNFTLNRCNITNNGNATDERGIELNELAGSGAITNSVISGSSESNARIENDTANLSSFNITGTTFSTTNFVTGDDGLIILNNGSAAMNLSVTGCTFTDNKGDHFQAGTDADATGSVTFTFSNNTLTTTPGNDPNVIGGGITISPSGSADFSFTINNNNIQQAFDEGINLNLGTASTAAASMIGTISNNIVGTFGLDDSGSESGTCLSIVSNGAGQTTVAVTGNQLYEYANPYGLLLNIKEGSSNMNATVTGNTIASPGTFALNGMRVDAGATAGDSGTLCATISGNSVTGSGLATEDVRLRQRFNTTIRLPGYGGSSSDTAAVNSFVSGNNGGASVSSAHNVGGGGSGFVGGAACPTP